MLFRSELRISVLVQVVGTKRAEACEEVLLHPDKRRATPRNIDVAFFNALDMGRHRSSSSSYGNAGRAILLRLGHKAFRSNRMASDC